MNKAYQQFSWLSSIVSAKDMGDMGSEKARYALLDIRAGRSKGTYVGHWNPKANYAKVSLSHLPGSAYAYYYHRAHKVWLVSRDGRVIAQVHPTWWQWLLGIREISVNAVLKGMGNAVREVAYVVHVHYMAFGSSVTVYTEVDEMLSQVFSQNEKIGRQAAKERAREAFIAVLYGDVFSPHLEDAQYAEAQWEKEWDAAHPEPQ